MATHVNRNMVYYRQQKIDEHNTHLSLHLKRASSRGTGVCRATIAKESNTCSYAGSDGRRYCPSCNWTNHHETHIIKQLQGNTTRHYPRKLKLLLTSPITNPNNNSYIYKVASPNFLQSARDTYLF